MKITLIAAMDGKDGIGKNGTLPWYIPEDLKHFKAYTEGKVCVMGRKTWDSLPVKPLPNRTNMILTKSGWGNLYDFINNESVIVPCGDVIMDVLDVANKSKFNEFCIIGGASIYEQFLPHATHMILTKTDLGIDYECDTFFPDFDESEWICTETKGLCDLVWVEYLERKQ